MPGRLGILETSERLVTLGILGRTLGRWQTLWMPRTLGCLKGSCHNRDAGEAGDIKVSEDGDAWDVGTSWDVGNTEVAGDKRDRRV